MLIALAVTAAVGGAGVVVWKMYRADQAPPPRRTDFQKRGGAIPAASLAYEEVTPAIQTILADPSGLALSPDGRRIYVGGRKLKQIHVLAPGGDKVGEIPTPQSPWALAVADDDGTIYAALDDHVEAYAPSGAPKAAWDKVAGDAALTSIAVWKDDVFVAKVVQRKGYVLRYRRADGKLVQTFDGLVQPGQEEVGFVVPSPYMDLAIGRKDGWLWVVNPGRRRLEAYALDCGPARGASGDLVRWGHAGEDLSGFCGCCNPAHVAILPDGRFVTAEKGLTRVKVYDGAGKLAGLVAGPEQFATHDEAARGRGADGTELRALEVAADHTGRIYVLDPATGQVRVFRPKAAAQDVRPPQARRDRRSQYAGSSGGGS